LKCAHPGRLVSETFFYLQTAIHAEATKILIFSIFIYNFDILQIYFYCMSRRYLSHTLS